MLKIVISILFVIHGLLCLFYIVKINQITLKYRKSVFSPSSEMSVDERGRIKKYIRKLGFTTLSFLIIVIIFFIINSKR